MLTLSVEKWKSVIFYETIPENQNPEEIFSNTNYTTHTGSECLGTDLVLGYCVLHHTLQHQVDAVLVTSRDDIGTDLINFVPGKTLIRPGFTDR